MKKIAVIAISLTLASIIAYENVWD